MSELFTKTFGTGPAATEKAPARANLLGEHTDYNDGFVLPTPLPYFTTVSVGPGKPGEVEAFAAQFNETLTRRLDAPAHGDWLDYVLGCVRVVQQQRVPVEGLRVAIESDVPMGAGISSSAALEVATLRALRRWLELSIDDEMLARMGQRAESGYVGMPCGIMDQMVSSVGRPGAALFLDTRSSDYEHVPLPRSHEFAVVHSGVSHKLTDGGYRQRRTECEQAAAALNVASLRELDVDDLPAIEALPEPLSRRARHVITENRRVLDGMQALRAGDAQAFGRLMVESHRSQRDDYAVSVPEIDALVESALQRGALGARLTGGGFGGCIIALVSDAKAWWPAVQADHPNAWLVYPR